VTLELLVVNLNQGCSDQHGNETHMLGWEEVVQQRLVVEKLLGVLVGKKKRKKSTKKSMKNSKKKKHKIRKRKKKKNCPIR